MDHIEELSFLLTKLCADIESVNKSIKRPAKERLMISASGKRMMYFSQKGSGKSRKLRYINSDPDHIYYLAYQAFQTELLRRLEYNEARLASVFKELKPLDHQSIIQDLPKHFDLLDPVRVVHPGYKKYGHTYPNPSWIIAPREAELTIGNMDPFEWAAMEYCENTERKACRGTAPGHLLAVKEVC